MRCSSSILLTGLSASLLCAVTPSLPTQESGNAEDGERSVLFWLIDTCRADRLSVYGYERPTTPFLERLSAEGVTFERCYSQAPWTKPSMSSIMTSLYPTRHGSTDMFRPLPDSFTTFPERLREAGWHTVGFSANPMFGTFTNLKQGFAEFKDSWEMIGGNSPMDYASGSAATIAGHATKWLDANDRWPFLLYMHSMDPHEWYAPADEFNKWADPEVDAAFRKNWDLLMDTHENVVNTCTRKTFEEAGVEIEPFVGHASNLYDADILANDTAIESFLERLGGDEFIVIVTADHGTEFFDHGATSLGHSLYEEMIHVPLVIWAPGLLPSGLRFSEPVRSVDIYPTLFELLDKDIPEDLAGSSLVPWIREKKATEPRIVFSDNVEERSAELVGQEPSAETTNGDSYAVIAWPWKLILNEKPRLGLVVPRHELFNLVQDPLEKKNLAGAQPGLVRALENKLLAHIAEGGAVPVPKGEALGEVDPKALEALRALGYVGDD